ncbi:MAG: recombinase family protein [Pseudoclavibacter sp.]
MTDEPQKRAALYARISQDDDTFAKTESQIEAARKLAKAAGYLVTHELDEGAASAYLQGVKRPQFDKLTALVQDREIDVVVAADQDRLARKPEEAVIFARLCADAGVLWHFTNSNQIRDLSDPSDNFQTMMMGAFASYESGLKRMRLAARFESRRAKGEPLWGPRPFGFEPDRMTHRDSDPGVVGQESEAQELRNAYDAILNKKRSLSWLVRDWEARGIRTPLAANKDPKRPAKRLGGNTYQIQTLKALLLSVRNAGIAQTGRGDTATFRKAAWDPIVSEEIFRKVEAKLTDPDRATKRGTKKKYLSAGLVLCACGHVLRSGLGNKKPYLRCPPSYEHRTTKTAAAKVHSNIAMEVAEPFVREALVRAIVEAPMPDPEAGLSAREVAVEVEISQARQAIRRQKLVIETVEEDEVASTLKRISELSKTLTKLEAERDEQAGKRRSSLADLRAEWLTRDPDTGRVRFSFSTVTDLYDAVRAKLDTLSIEDQTALAREYIEVRLAPGRARGTKRLSVRYLKSPHLDRTPENEAAEDWAEAMSWVEDDFDYMVAELDRPAELDRVRLHRSVPGYVDMFLHRQGR